MPEKGLVILAMAVGRRSGLPDAMKDGMTANRVPVSYPRAAERTENKLQLRSFANSLVKAYSTI